MPQNRQLPVRICEARRVLFSVARNNQLESPDRVVTVQIAERQILRDWTRVENYVVDEREQRTFEYHVVKDLDAERLTLTIKCFNDKARTVRLDPTVIPANADPETYKDIAGRRVRHLYSNGMI